jgi:putative hydrolase of the HAD superfamily
MKDSDMNPEQTLLIDDALVNVEAARKAGMKAIHLKPGMSLLDLDWGV